MEKILQAARELGHDIASTDIYKRYIRESKKLAASPDDMELLKKFTTRSRYVKEMQLNSIEVREDEMMELNSLAQQVHDSDLITEYLEAQSEFLSFMDEIFGEIETA